MELLLNINTVSDIVNNSWNLDFSDEEECKIREVIGLDGVNKLARINIGPGADLLVILAAVNIVADVFLVGSKVLEGMESWKKIIAKIKGFKQKNELVSLDAEAAELLAIDYLYSRFEYDTIKLIDGHCFNITDLEGLIQVSSNFARKPHNYYIQSYLLDGEHHVIVGVMSSGEVTILKQFGLSNYGLEEILFKE